MRGVENMRLVSSWGRLEASSHQVLFLNDPSKVPELICQRGFSGQFQGKKTSTSSVRSVGLPYGMGRSYGDVCLNPQGTLWCTKGLDHFLALDEEKGRLTCEAGVSFQEVQRLLVPRGWILPVNPGTQMVTVGGAIANDVHGKNHHLFGSFGNHVRRLKLLRTDGEVIECGPQLREDWFRATVGGLGLTGLILEAEIQLQPVKSPWLETETIAYSHLDEFFFLSKDSGKHWTHTVSWVDCISGNGQRGLFMRGRPWEPLFKETSLFKGVPLCRSPL